MSEAKHTPGPWRANRFSIIAAGSTDTYSGTVWGCIAYAEELYDNCDLEGRQWSTSGDRAANARLIAAAPDLLEALGELLPQNLGAPPDALQDHMTVPVDMTIGEIRRALAAIAKAKGDT